MKSRNVVLAAAITFAALLVPRSAWAFGVGDVLKLHREQVSDSLIVLQIEHTGQVIRLSSQDFRKLKQAGVSDEVIGALVRSDRPKQTAPPLYGPPLYAHVYAPYSYGYYPSLSFGLRFGYPVYRYPLYRRYYPFPYRYRRS